MKFRTEIKLPSYPFRVNYQTQIFGLGSCFVDHMKRKFDYFQFQNLINDFGVIFNPASINTLVERIINQNFYTPKDLFYHQNVWKNFELHSSLNTADPEQLINQVNRKLKENLSFIRQSDLIIFTLGTAWVYRHKKSGKIVANCHKVAAKEFDKILLSPTEITEILSNTIRLLKKENKKTKILFSLSPVRHLKDGFIENQRSKAHLLTAVHELVDYKNVFYFPSYEILMDDLRDYRFYKTDLIHPNEVAVEYIWNQLVGALMDTPTKNLMKKVEKIRKSLDHKPFDKNSPDYKNHLQKINHQILQLQKDYPWMNFT